MKRYLCFFLLSLLTFSSIAKADIVLSEVIVDFIDQKDVRKDIVVQNVSNKKVFVAVQPFQIADPVKDKSERIPLKDPRNS